MITWPVMVVLSILVIIVFVCFIIFLLIISFWIVSTFTITTFFYRMMVVYSLIFVHTTLFLSFIFLFYAICETAISIKSNGCSLLRSFLFGLLTFWKDWTYDCKITFNWGCSWTWSTHNMSWVYNLLISKRNFFLYS